MGKISETKSVATFIRVWPFMRKEKSQLVIISLITLGLTAVELTVPIMVGIYVDSLINDLRQPGEQVSTLGLTNMQIIAVLAAAAVARGLLFFLQRALAGKMGQRVAGRMRDAVWVHLQKLPMEYSRRRGPGRLLMRFISDARAVQRLVSRGVIQLFQDILTIIGVVAVLMYIDIYMGLVIAGIVPVVALVFRYINPRLQDTSRDMRRRKSKMSAHLSGRIKGLEVVKSYGHQRDEARDVRRLNRNVVKHGSRREVAGGAMLGASAGAVALVTVGALALAGTEVASGRLTTGELVMFYTLVGLLAPVFQRITVVNRTLQEAEISMQRLSETLAKPIEGEQEGEELPEIEVTDGTVSVENVSYSHEDGEVLLDEISFEAHRGEIVVLTGPNGSGKSTLLEIMLRFQEPEDGNIRIDGQDISEVSLRSLRSKVNLVTQETPLFDGTVRENIAYGDISGEISDERLEEVARSVGLMPLIESLPDGWDTKIREGRREISDGQRQRVVLARSLVANPEVLLLDQAASAVDEDTLRELLSTVREFSRDKTVIISSHRLQVLLEADRILALQDGNLIEISPEVLRKRHEESLHSGNGSVSLFGELLPERTAAKRRTAATSVNREFDDEDDDE